MPALIRVLASLSVLSLTASAQEVPATPAPASGLHWKDLIADPGHIRFYGFLRLDAQYDDSRASNGQTIGWVLSEDPLAATGPGSPGVPGAPGGGEKNRENLGLHPRLTRFGLDVDGGEVASLGAAKVTGKIEIDFYNSGLTGQSESRAAIRMRHAYLKLGWTDWTLLCGQTNDVISPLFPVVNADLVMWGAGNLGDRRPQARLEWCTGIGEAKLTAQTEVGLTGAVDNQNLDTAAGASSTRDGEASGLPTVQARVALAFPIASQKAEIGVWGHQGWETTDTGVGASGERDFESDAYGVDVSLPLFRDIVRLQGEAWQGKNLDDVRGGIFQGINSTTGSEIDSSGGFAELGVKITAHNTLYAGVSRDNPESGDVALGGRADNKVWYLASRWNHKPVTFGLEYLNWTTKFVGFNEGTDNRFVAFIAYNF